MHAGFTNGLFLLAVAQVIITGQTVLIFGRELLTTHKSPGNLFGGVSILVGEMVALGCLAVLAVITTIALFKRNRLFRFLFATQWLFALLICAADFLIMLRAWTWRLDATAQPTPISGPIRIVKVTVRDHLLEDNITSFAGILIFGGLLLGYVLLSKRARALFSQ